MTTLHNLTNTTGGCRTGTYPLYRLYNAKAGGAPNHRLTTSLERRGAMIDKGWVSEGAGESGVAACVPSLRGDEL